ncbi:MAG: hypothetical protein CVU71_00205 [Deltaproteobacteria bacterium HGW-Deltaproteobacteria-6]|nr:MAG: hypothetical protein CVU71_00205 [Deltaproteobacteria bacterium HGW-Deltaproteobacteria-6]
MRHIQTTPARMVEEDGSINFGTFRMPFRNANLPSAPLYSFPAPGFWKNFRLKEWQHYGIITPTHYFGMVIFDAKFTGVSFFYVYDRLKNTRFEHTRQACKKNAVHTASQLYDDACWFDAKGYRLRFENKLDQGVHRILIDIDRYKNRPAVQGEITVHEDLKVVEPLVQVSPITRTRPFYTHKAAVPASGSMVVDSEEIILNRNSTIALIDDQKTYYPYVSFWKWATAAGFSDEGKLLAFNLCQNMIADDEEFNENCFWMDGRISCLTAARFDFGDVMKPWKIKTTDGKLDLSFVPSGERAEKINTAGIIRSDFHQPFGLYSGSFKDDQGIIHPIKDLFGLTEHHITRY